MNRLLLSHAAALGILALTHPGASAQTTSTFDTGLEGWTGTGGAVTYVATGGDSGGFLRQADTDGSWMTVFAPAPFHGDLSSFLGGIVSFSGRNINAAAPDLSSAPWFGTVTIVGAAATASATLAGTGPGQPVADGAWHHFSAPLTAARWSGDLNAALANVTSMSVVLEFNDTTGAEVAGFDNFRISAVPESGTLALLSCGLLGVAMARRPRCSGAASRAH